MVTDSSYGQVLHLPRSPHKGGDNVPPPDVRVLTDVLSGQPFDPAGTGFVLSVLPEGAGPVLWVQDRASRQENGQIYAAGFARFGLRRAVLHVTVSHPRDVLWAMEEGAACAGLSAVIGEIHGAPKVLDFTATKRLALRAERSGVPVFLLRSGDPGTLSAARERWRIGSRPSFRNPFDQAAPGAAQWEAELFRARGRAPGRWTAGYDANRLYLVSQTDPRTLEAGDHPVSDPAGHRRSGGIVA